MSPPETTSADSWPTTCPSWRAKSVPPSERIIWPAFSTMLLSSSGT